MDDDVMSVTQNDFFKLFNFIRENSYKPALTSMLVTNFEHLKLSEETLQLIVKLVIDNIDLDNSILLIIIEKFNVKIEYNVKQSSSGVETQMKKNIVSTCLDFVSTILSFEFLEANVRITWLNSSPYNPKNKDVVMVNEKPSIEMLPMKEGYFMKGSFSVREPLIAYLGAHLKYSGKLQVRDGAKKMQVVFDKPQDLLPIFSNFQSKIKQKTLHGYTDYLGYFSNFKFMNEFVLFLMSSDIKPEATIRLIEKFRTQKKIKVGVNPASNHSKTECEHNHYISNYFNNPDLSLNDFNEFILNFITAKGGIAYCKICGQKIEECFVFEYQEAVTLIPNYDIFRRKPYSNYVFIDVFIDDFMFNFINLSKINLTQYIPILVMKLIEELESIAESRLELEDKYKKDIPEHIFFSRLNNNYFYTNAREDEYYTKLRHYYTTITMIYLLVTLLNTEDFNHLLYNLKTKPDVDFIRFMARITTKYLSKVNLNIFGDDSHKIQKTFIIIDSVVKSNLSELFQTKLLFFSQFSKEVTQSEELYTGTIKLQPSQPRIPILITTGEKFPKMLVTKFVVSSLTQSLQEKKRETKGDMKGDMKAKIREIPIVKLVHQDVNEKTLDTILDLDSKVEYYLDGNPVNLEIDEEFVRIFSKTKRKQLIDVVMREDTFDFTFKLQDTDEKLTQVYNFFNGTDPYLYLDSFDESISFQTLECFIRDVENHEDMTFLFPTGNLPKNRREMMRFKLSLFSKEIEEFLNSR